MQIFQKVRLLKVLAFYPLDTLQDALKFAQKSYSLKRFERLGVEGSCAVGVGIWSNHVLAEQSFATNIVFLLSTKSRAEVFDT